MQEKDNYLVIAYVFGGVVIVVAAIIIAMFMFEGVRPALLDMRREGNQQSQQYVETTKGRLFQLNRKYEDLEFDIVRLSENEDNGEIVNGMIARQESLLDEMEEEANSIPSSEIPEKIKELLLEKGRLK